jgi:hypothetical protein
VNARRMEFSAGTGKRDSDRLLLFLEMAASAKQGAGGYLFPAKTSRVSRSSIHTVTL